MIDTVPPDTLDDRFAGTPGAASTGGGGGGAPAPGYRAAMPARSSAPSGAETVRLKQPDEIEGYMIAGRAAAWPKPIAWPSSCTSISS